MSEPADVPTDQPPRRGFVWPPRAGNAVDVVRLRPEAGAPAPPIEPRPARDSIDIPSIAPAPIRPARFPALRAGLLEVESVWLGLTRAPFLDRARERGWTPDSAGEYCPRCGVSCGQHEALDPDELAEGVPLADAGCPECRAKRLPWNRLIRLGEYRDLLQEAVLEVKFSRWRRLGRDIGRVLGEQVAPHLDRAGVDRSRLAIVPVPIAFWRRFFRGIDHTLAICRGVQDATGGRIMHLLHRRPGPSQLSVTAARRKTNIAGSMRPRRALASRSWQGWTFLVVDDVKTTGATMTETCKTLRRGLADEGKAARIWAAVAAVAGERPGHRPAPDPS